MDVHVEKGQAVHITWLDSSSLHGWVSDDLKPESKSIESIGFVAAVGDDSLTITSGRTGTGIINPLNIPFCCIQNYELVEL